MAQNPVVHRSIRIRLGLAQAATSPVEYSQRRRPIDGIDEIVAQIEEEAAIRRLVTGWFDEQARLACTWAREWVERLEGSVRRRALLKAQRLLVACLAASGRAAEAKKLLASVLARTAELGLVRFPVDGGPLVVELVEELNEDQKAARWQSDWHAVPAEFLQKVIAAPR